MGLPKVDTNEFGKAVSDDDLKILCESVSSPKLPRPKQGEPYLGGPIPMSWIERATSLPGKAWHLACALWFEALCEKSKPATVQLPSKTRKRFGLDRRTYYRALETLRKAGLVRVEFKSGKLLDITILPAPVIVVPEE